MQIIPQKWAAFPVAKAYKTLPHFDYKAVSQKSSCSERERERVPHIMPCAFTSIN